MIHINVFTYKHVLKHCRKFQYVCSAAMGCALVTFVGFYTVFNSTPVVSSLPSEPFAGLIDPVSSSHVTDMHKMPNHTDLRAVVNVLPATLPNIEMPAPANSPDDMLIASPVGIKYAIDVKRGDTLLSVLVDSGLDEKTALANLQEVKQSFNPNHLKVGDNVELVFKPASYRHGDAEAERKELAALLIERRHNKKPVATWSLDTTSFWSNPEPYNPDPHDLTLVNTPNATGPIIVTSNISSSFTRSAYKAGLSKKHTQDVVNLLRYSLDFERDIHAGASFKVMFERIRNAQGQLVDGKLQYIELNNKGKILAFYRTELPDGRFGYFDKDGKTNKRSLMKTPVSGARISSKFGMRHHPVLGYNKMHKGVDFAASTGTPIYAAGDGIIEKSYYSRSYGNYVMIRHNGHYKTAYAHMSKFGKGIKNGKRVVQGEIIGYVGSTGRSTGPHLHFEVLHKGKQINPMTMKDFGHGGLSGKALANFEKSRNQISSIIKNNNAVALK